MRDERKKEYDRKRAALVYEDFKLRREKAYEVLGGECFICKAKAVKGYHFHHKEYHPTESNYPRHSKSMYVRLKRLNEVENNPDRFTLLCPKDHILVEALKRSEVDLDKLIKLVKQIV